MPSFWGKTIRDALLASPGMWDATAPTVVAVLLPMAPKFEDNDARYTGITADIIPELTTLLGWGAPLQWDSTYEVPVAAGSIDVYPVASVTGRKVMVLYNSADKYFILPDEVPLTLVKAVAFVNKGVVGGVTDPIIFVTDDLLRPNGLVLAPGDEITARPDGNVTGGVVRVMQYWTVPGDGTITFNAGHLEVMQAAPPFDASHTQHAWLYPQRVNFIANPSFERNLSCWSSGATLQQVADAAPGGGVNAGRFSGSSPLILESNIFPLKYGVRQNSDVTLRVFAKGDGVLKMALILWEDTFDATSVDWGEEEWTLDPDDFTEIVSYRAAAEGAYGLLRLETDGTELLIDNVMVEPDWLPGFPYFDGDSSYGAPGDYSWYGAPNPDAPGASYSCWYNNRNAVTGRLFAWEIEEPTAPPEPVTRSFNPVTYVPTNWLTAPPGAAIQRIKQTDVPVILDASVSTSSVLTNQGNSGATLNGAVTGATKITPDASDSYVWLPGFPGNFLSVPHETAFNTPTALTVVAEMSLPDWTPATSEQALVSKWVSAGIAITDPAYIMGVEGSGRYVSTPSIAGMNITGDTVILFRVRMQAIGAMEDPGGGFLAVIASADGRWEIKVHDDFSNPRRRLLQFSWGKATVDGGAMQRRDVCNLDDLDLTRDQWLGIRLWNSGGVGHAHALQSNDEGVTWVSRGTEKLYNFNINAPGHGASPQGLRIANDLTGAVDTGWRGRLYWVEMRSGLDPLAGTLRFRCDPSERTTLPSTTWTDTRSQVWTASTAGALVDGGPGVPIANSWVFSVLSTGLLKFKWSIPVPPPWTAVGLSSQYTCSAPLTFADNDHKFVAVTFQSTDSSHQARIRFYTSPDGTPGSWTQLGVTSPSIPEFNIISGTGRIAIGGQDNSGATPLVGNVYSARIASTTGVTGLPSDTPVLDVDCTELDPDDAQALSFSARTGQIVTIARSTTGYVTTVVPSLAAGGRPFFMLDGVNDLIQILDDAVFSFAPSGTFTVFLTVRQKVGIKTSFYVSKAVSSPSKGWWLNTATGNSWHGVLADGVGSGVDTGGTSIKFQQIRTIGFRVASSKLTGFESDSLMTPVTIASTGSDNPQPIRIGNYPGQTNPWENFDVFAFTIVKGAITDQQVGQIALAMEKASDQYFQGDKWAISASGTFQGLELTPTDVLVAVHPSGLSSPMRFEDVVWKIDSVSEDVVTNREVEKQGLVYKWIPGGNVIHHDDVLYPNDPKTRPNCAPRTVLSRTEVPNPWPLTVTYQWTLSATGVAAGDCTQVLVEPFDNLTRWTGTAGSSIVVGRNGTAVSHTGSTDLIYTVSAPNRSNYVTIGLAWRTSSVGTATRNVLRLRESGGTVLCLLAVTVAGAVQYSVGDGARVLHTSASSVIAADTWYYFEVQTYLAESGGSYTLRMNNTVLATATGIDTMPEPSATGPVADILLPNISGATTMVDDLYLTTGAGCPFKGDIAATYCTDVVMDPLNDFSRGTSFSGSTIIAGRNGSGLQCTAVSAAIDYTVPASSRSDTITIGFAYRWTDGLAGRYLFLIHSDTTTVQNRLAVTSTGGLAFYRFSTSVATSANGLLVANTWYYIEAKIKLHNVNGTAVVRLNGVEVINFAGDTRGQTTATGVYDLVRVGNSGVASTVNQYDDLYLSSGAGCSFKGDITVPSAQTLTVVGGSGVNDPVTNTTSGNVGVRVAFDVVGHVIGVRYKRLNTSAGTLTIRAWNDTTTAKVAEIDDVRSTTGQYTVMFPVPVPVTTTGTWTFTVGSPATGNPVSGIDPVVTNTADMNYVVMRSSFLFADYPNMNEPSGNTYYVEPIFQPDP